ncbi:MAG TPA: helix-turn-helix transcriptional regulator [Anaerolineales bacterium]|nr:helix-turn-helix transcriptional regulator [Anaerolineales bacterium]HLF01129.1 helix-turn-helix transcriptional regulator [Anaerolineales bacterium]
MADKKSLALRAKIIGVLLRDARLTAGKTPKDCGTVLGISASAYAAFELGKKSLSLPELELLAYYLDIPLTHFWGDEILTEAPERTSDVDSDELIALRHRIIGAQIRQARTGNSIALKELAAAVGIPASRLKAYEFGELPVPVPELETLAWVLGMKIDNFFERQGPVGEWDASRRAYEKFKDLPQAVQDFVMNPINEAYLRVAMNLADMPSDKIKDVAASLLDITF